MSKSFDPSQILYEDNHLLVINKLPGQLVQGDKTGDISLDKELKQYIKEKFNKPGEVYLGIPHRLDRPVSGVVIYARTSKAMTRMCELFRTKKIQKSYLALVENRPNKAQDRLIHHLKKNEKQNKSYAHIKPVDGSKESILSYKYEKSSDRYHLLDITLETGRHHQIRCQLSTIGCCIKGDLKYGSKRSNPNASISLHAHKAVFEHPVKKEPIQIVAHPPNDKLWNFFNIK